VENSGNEDSDESAGTEEYQQVGKSKKLINKGRWSKEEVSYLYTGNDQSGLR